MTAPRRIVHVVRRFDPLVGGLERYVGDLAHAQARRGNLVTVVTLDRDVNGVVHGRLPPRQVESGVQIVRIPGFGSGRFGVTFRPDVLIRIVRRSDVTHVHDLRFMVGTVAIANRLAGRPTILHTHGLIYGTRAFWRLKRLLSWLYYQPLLLATRTLIVCSSAADRSRLLEFMPRLEPRASTIENAVDLAPFREVVRAPLEGRIVVIGRVARIKGIDRLLRALRHVEAPWTLSIQGAPEGGEVERLTKVAIELGIADRVAFTGAFRSNDEPALLASPSLAVFPSTSEALGMALVDAMAAGLPVLASDIPAHREVLESVAPELLVDFDDESNVGTALQRLLSMPPRELEALAGRVRVRAGFFDMNRLLVGLEDVYRAATESK